MSSKHGGRKKVADGRTIVCENRKARHDYAFHETLEAGLVLTGTEVKSCREGKANLNDAYIQVRSGEAMMVGGNIAEYKYGNQLNHDPTRTRKLLLHKNEVERLHVAIAQKGESVIPLSMYFKNGWAKIELGVGKGRKHEDKRQVLKERQVKRELDRVMRRRR